MPTLSAHQPWPELIVAGRKPIEVRYWRHRPSENYVGQRIAIHAGKQRAKRSSASAEAAFREINASYPRHNTIVVAARRGGIVGVATLSEVFRFTQQSFVERHAEHLNPVDWWHDDPPCWGLRFVNPVRFEQMIPCRGQQKFFEVGAEVAEAVRRAIGA